MHDGALTCDHCGGDAISAADDVFYDGEGERCDDCGHPGSVSVYEDGTASWLPDDEDCARCPVRGSNDTHGVLA